MQKVKTVKTPTPSRTAERRFGEANEHMVDLMSRIYQKQVLEALNVSTINKFADAPDQSGNYARAFKRLSVSTRKKLMQRFSNTRIERMAKDFLEKSDRETQAKLYAAVEKKVGIPAAQLALSEATRSTKNALILETAQWMQKLRDETLELYTSNTMFYLCLKALMLMISKAKRRRKCKIP